MGTGSSADHAGRQSQCSKPSATIGSRLLPMQPRTRHGCGTHGLAAASPLGGLVCTHTLAGGLQEGGMRDRSGDVLEGSHCSASITVLCLLRPPSSTTHLHAEQAARAAGGGAAASLLGGRLLAGRRAAAALASARLWSRESGRQAQPKGGAGAADPGGSRGPSEVRDVCLPADPPPTSPQPTWRSSSSSSESSICWRCCCCTAAVAAAAARRWLAARCEGRCGASSASSPLSTC